MRIPPSGHSSGHPPRRPVGERRLLSYPLHEGIHPEFPDWQRGIDTWTKGHRPTTREILVRYSNEISLLKGRSQEARFLWGDLFSINPGKFFELSVDTRGLIGEMLGYHRLLNPSIFPEFKRHLV